MLSQGIIKLDNIYSEPVGLLLHYKLNVYKGFTGWGQNLNVNTF